MPHAEVPQQIAPPRCDLVIVGGGINGAGIARDAAGRGIHVVLCEKDDLAAHTSSASTKLLHGGLRYLEHYEFALVRKALRERTVLLKLAPHIAKPLRFILPHEPHLRAEWLIRAGLMFYDHLAPRGGLPAAQLVDLAANPVGNPLNAQFRRGFTYWDGWVDDARLVVLNALDAREHGATILTRTVCTQMAREGDHFIVTLRTADGSERTVRARAVVNAAGPWAATVAAMTSGTRAKHGLTLVKGSHIVVPRLYAHDDAYIFQNADRRIVFAIPYEGQFTLIGTTDVEYSGDPGAVRADGTEVAYLCAVASRYFAPAVTPAQVVYTYSGVRPLLAGESSHADAAMLSRDYALELETSVPALLHVFGGKLTTYRRLAEEAVERIAPLLGHNAGAWTAGAPLPGGDLGPGGLEHFTAVLVREYRALPEPLLARYARSYGTRARCILGAARSVAELGREVVAGLYERELDYLLRYEWARTADDILFRRSKLGLHLAPGASRALDQWIGGRCPRNLGEALA